MLPFSAIVATEHILCCVNGTVSHSVSDTQTFQLSNLNGALPAHIPAVIYTAVVFNQWSLRDCMGVPQQNELTVIASQTFNHLTLAILEKP